LERSRANSLDKCVHKMYTLIIMKQRAVRLMEEIHHKAKVKAAKEGITLQKLVEKALRQYLENKRQA